jgi:hypothetical protein
MITRIFPQSYEVLANKSNNWFPVEVDACKGKPFNSQGAPSADDLIIKSLRFIIKCF